MSKPRLAEILGVEVGQEFTVGGGGAYIINADGTPETVSGSTNEYEHIVEAINYPEKLKIVYEPKLTATERAFCKAAGVKWISRDYVTSDAACLLPVDLWNGRPEFDLEYKAYFINDCRRIGVVVSDTVFQSVRPGDCFQVEYDEQ